jgi:hypothetical protein
MTAQHPDTVRFRQRSYALTAVNGQGLFDPTAHGLQPRPLSTACYRGFVCSYQVDDQQLVLNRLEIGLADQPASGPELLGTRPRRPTDDIGDESLYEDILIYDQLGMPVAFTGKLLVGDGDPDERPHLNMGFWPAWMYEVVYELIFDRGRLLAAHDRSAALAEVRRRRSSTGATTRNVKSLEDWIGRTFSLDYDYSWPRED